MGKKTLHLVFQTHWDREWYWSFESFRMRLIRVIARVLDALDEKEIDRFVLDGQTLPLEDVLEVIETNDRERLLARIHEGNIVIGPWFVAMDEFLVHGESIIRNLEIGKKTAEKYGKNQSFGYLPDTFGHLGQMPQILRNFGIEDAMMWRGVSLEQSEFIWEGIDGSRLFSIYLTEGYYQPLFNHDQYLRDIGYYMGTIDKRATTPHLLMTAGGDHLMPIRTSLSQRLDTLKASFPDTEFKVNDYLGYISSVKKDIRMDQLVTLRGELNSNEKSYILPNVWSTRSYLKINNQTLEDLMLGQIEPMIASRYLRRSDAPFQYVDQLWKLILENQPHDSICGCSIDEVHAENEMRTLKAMQRIDALKRTILNDASHRSLDYFQNDMTRIDAGDKVFSVFNPHPYPYSGYVKGHLFLHDSEAMDAFDVETDDHIRFETVIESVEKDRLFESPLDYPPFFRPGKTYAIHIDAKKLSPLSWTRLRLVKKNATPKMEKVQTIENRHVSITLESDGTLTFVDKARGTVLRGMHRIFSSLDAGDTYNYAKPMHDLLSFASLNGVFNVECDGFLSTMTYQLSMIQPSELTPDRQGPSHTTVRTLIDVNITLYEHDPLARFHITVDQKAKDQRLRIAFPLTSLAKESVADSAFELKRNACNRDEIDRAGRLKEVPVAVDHSLSMIRIDDQRHALVFAHRGLHEYQTVKHDDKTDLEVTLIRSVSHLSRDDFGSRGGAAGPNLATPDAQSIRTLEIDYAIGLFPKTDDCIDHYHRVQSYRKPPIVTKGSVPDSQISLFSISNMSWVVTSVRLKSIGVTEVRLWNPSDHEQKGDLMSDYPILSIDKVLIDGTLIGKVSPRILLKSNEIATFLIRH